MRLADKSIEVALRLPMNQKQNFVATDSGFFGIHGLFAPGVKLFRRLSFSSKSALILAVMLLPLVWALWLVYSAKTELISTTKRERQGVAYVNSVTLLMRDMAEFRRASVVKAPDLSDKKDLVGKALSKVQQAQKEFGHSFGGATDESFDSFDKSVEALLKTPCMLRLTKLLQHTRLPLMMRYACWVILPMDRN